MQKRVIFSFILSILLLSFISISVLAVKTDNNFEVFTIVTVVEGEVMVYQYKPEELPGGIFGETANGFILNRINDDLVKVSIKEKGELCYILPYIREDLDKYFKSGLPVLVQRNYRVNYNTEWDVIAIGVLLEWGYEYAEGEIYAASKEKLQSLMEEVKAIPPEAAPEEEPTIIETEEPIDTTRPKPGKGPTACISANPTSGVVPLLVSFDGRSSSDPDGIIISYDWNYGDGNTATGAQVSHTFNSAGVFIVTLTVTDNDGNTDSDTIIIDTTGEAPTAVISADMTSGGIPLTVSFDSSGSYAPGGTIVSYDWDFGDGGTASGSNVSHTFTTTGIFTVTLTVTDNNGKTGSSSVTINTTGQEYYYVNPVNGEDKTGKNSQGYDYGSSQAPWKTITFALANADTSVSTTINLASGTYSASTNGETLPIVMKSGITLTGQGESTVLNGGGTSQVINCWVVSNITISKLRITNGSSSNYGGGLNCSVSYINISECTIDGNTSTLDGGGLFNGDSGILIISKCTIKNNTARWGGGIGSYGANSTLLAINCLIFGNTAERGAGLGGRESPTIINCTISGNNCTGGWGAITSEGGGSATIINCIISGNNTHGFYSIGTGLDVLKNCFFFSNSSGNYWDTFSGTRNTSAEIDNANPGNNSGNIGSDLATDPNFKNPASGDYHLSGSTPSTIINGGISEYDGLTQYIPSDDLDSRTRSGNPDIGCYEYIAGDPLVTGRVYDSVTGETVSGVGVYIYRKGGTTPLSVTSSNPYSFNVDTGTYFLIVKKSGYYFPSTIVDSAVAGDHGDIFELTGDTVINIPIDPEGYLLIEKTANKKQVQIGDIITYNIKIQNKYWFGSVENVVLVDEITNGFKYVSNSTYLDSSEADNPAVSGHKARFTLGTISSYTTINLSYQVRVGPGIVPGRYKATAVARNNLTEEEISNESNVEVEVINDPLFSTGTIIGKVFYDLDGNGIQESVTVTHHEGGEVKEKYIAKEKGIPDIKLATEYGVVVTTDENGKFHIPNVHPGTHLIKIDTTTLPSGFKVLGENPYIVKITSGLLAKVNFPICIKEMEELSAPNPGENQFFIVGLGECIVRNLSTSGNIEMVQNDDTFDEGLRVDGRMAFYLKGKVLGKYLIKASLDTDRAKYPQRDLSRHKLFTNLDPDKYYPIYGDASEIDYSATDTQDILYLLVEWDKSHIKWGSFDTGIPLYNRTFSGGEASYQSVKKTKFGDPYTLAKGFYAHARQLPAHDEFIGTGGSLYYLRHKNVIEGSEKVTVGARDRVSKTTIATWELTEEKDYTIDYDQGRIILKKPLNSVNQSYNASIISNDILAGERVYLLVNYEYRPDSILSKQAWGGKVSQQIGNHLRIGGTYIEEKKDSDPYKLAGGDATIKLNEDTAIDISYTHSRETQLGSGISFDGGLTFSEKGDNFSEGKSGSAFSIDGRTELFGNTEVTASYSRQDPYFSGTDTMSTQGTKKYIAGIIAHLKKNLDLGLKHITQEILENTNISSSVTGNTWTHTSTAFLDYSRGKWDFRTEYQHQEVSNPILNYTYIGTIRLKRNDFLAARAGYQLTPWLHPYIRGQGTINGEANNQGTLGVDLNLWRDTSINLAETLGNLGDSTLIGITSKWTEDTYIYANIEVGNNIELGKFTRTTYGQTTRLGPASSVYVENDYSTWQEKILHGQVLGYEEKFSDTTALGLSYERANIEQEPVAISRDSGSATLSYLNIDWLKLFTKLEIRNDRGTSTIRQWLTENNIIWYITKSLSILGKAVYSLSRDITNDIEKAEFSEFGAGLAYRPVEFDRLNILAKYSYLTDEEPGHQNDFIQDTEARKHIYAIEGVFDICRYLQLVGKFAFRDMSEKVGPRGWTNSGTMLYIGRLNFHITNKWDIAGEYRVLSNIDSDGEKSGWLVELDREIFKYARIGVGYNFTDYDDDLSNDDDWDVRGWFVQVNGKY